MPQDMVWGGDIGLCDMATNPAEECWVYVPPYDLTMVEADKDEFIKAIRKARGISH